MADKDDKQKGTDPLDILTAIVVLILAATAWAVFAGYGVPAVSTVLALFAAAYFMAPRRRWPTAADVCEDVTGKVALVTGATSGIGIDTAGVLAQKGAKVYLAARNPAKLQTTKELIEKEYLTADSKGGSVHILTCDLNDLTSVKACTVEFLKTNSKLDILINNAGIMALPERRSTVQGLEQQVGVCHVGHFFLTKALLPAIEKAGTVDQPSRVVCLSSVGYRNHEMAALLKSKSLETEPYDPWVAYGNAKCANILFAAGLQEKTSKEVAAFSVHPGGIHTGLQTYVSPWKMFKWTIVTPFLFKSIPQGAATSLWCATRADPAKEGGQYFDNCAATSALAKLKSEVGADATTKLWTQTEELIKEFKF